MKGIQKIHIHNRKVDYDFELRRNITIIRGDSGTGKTTRKTPHTRESV